MSESPEALLAEATRLGQSGQAAAALTLCQQVLKAAPENPRAWHLQGLAQLQTSQPVAAIASFQAALQRAPAADTQGYLGVAYCQSGQLSAGIAHLQAALAAAPQSPLWLQNLWLALEKQGERVAATVIVQRLSDRVPQAPEFATRAARLLCEQQQPAEAIRYYQRALALQPQARDLWRELAQACRQSGDTPAAVQAWHTALSQDPADSAGWTNLGVIHLEQGRWPEARTCLERAHALQPDSDVILLNLAQLAMACQQPEQAKVYYQVVLRQQPESVAACEGQVRAQLASCDWEGLTPLMAKLQAVATRGGVPAENLSPYSSLFLAMSPHQQLQIARAQAARIQRKIRTHTPFQHPPPGARQRLRVGYLSADFRFHILGDMIWRLFECHDRQAFEIFAYATHPPEDSAHSRKFRREAEHFCALSDLSDQAAAARIAADRLDLLVFLGGYTDGDRAEILALRPAPLQLTYLDYPATLGADWIDYIIADRHVLPPALEPYFSERVLSLPSTYQLNNDQLPFPGERCTRQAAGLPAEGFVFCCFTKSNRLNPALFTRWLRILRAVPDSLLWLLHPGEMAAERLRAAFQAADLDPERLIFAPLLPKAAHIARQSAADLFLDTLPGNAHSTASDALRAGVPVLTLPGQTFTSRVGASLLHAVGLPELIAHSEDAYHACAVALARDPALLAGYRARLQHNALFDSAQRVRELEAAYQQLWAHHCRGAHPQRLDIQP